MSAYTNLKGIDSEVSTINYLDPGIHDNCEMVRLVVDTTTNGNNFMAFYFEDGEGKPFSHTEWEPKETDPIKLESKTNNLLKRVKHIATKFVSKDAFDAIVSTDFKSFCEGVQKVISEKYKGVKVRLKVTYNNKNFTSFPNYVPFVETMDINPTKLSIRTIDKMVKDSADREPVAVSNPFEPQGNVVDSKVQSGGLPF